MAKKKKTGMPWLRDRMAKLGYTSLEQVATDIGVNRGNLHRYFMLVNKPSVALLPVMSKVLDASYEDILKALECV